MMMPLTPDERALLVRELTRIERKLDDVIRRAYERRAEADARLRAR